MNHSDQTRGYNITYLYCIMYIAHMYSQWLAQGSDIGRCDGPH